MIQKNNRLSIGGIKSGMICLDPFDPRADISAPMWCMPLPNDAFDWVEAIHCLEHVAVDQVLPSLSEMKRVLRPGGTLAVMVPNVRKGMEIWLKAPSFPPPAVIWGSQKGDGLFHRCGFTETTLRKVMVSVGLNVQSVELLDGAGNNILSRKTVIGSVDPLFYEETKNIRAGILAHATKICGEPSTSFV